MNYITGRVQQVLILLIICTIHVVLCIDVNCDFEIDVCGWNQSSTASDGEASMWERHQGPTDTELTGPSSGHGGVDSWYMYVDGSKSHYDAQATLSSPFVINPDGRTECYFFSFWYHMSGEQVGSLSVLLYSTRSGVTEALWHQNTQRGNGWNQGGVQFTEQGHFKLLIIAKRGAGSRSDIGIDDLRLAKSYCGGTKQPNVISDYFECENGRLISTDLYCDGADQCEDGSDENDLACLEAQGMIGAFNFDALTIVGVVILLLLISILIVLLVVICHRRQQIETKPRPQSHHMRRGDDRRLMPAQNNRQNQPNQDNEHRPGICYYDEDRIRLTQCDDLSPSHVRIGSPPPYDSIAVENKGRGPVKGHDQRLILSNSNNLVEQPHNIDNAKGCDVGTDSNLIDVGVTHPTNVSALPISVPPAYAPPYGDNPANQIPAVMSTMPTAPPMELGDASEPEVC